MIVGVSGKIGSGKDAIAAHLVKEHGFRLIRFSDSLKEEILRILRRTCIEIWLSYMPEGYDLTPTDVELREMLWNTKPPIVRRLLQEWGTELRRVEQPDYWIRKWQDAVMPLAAAGVSVVAPDARFLNEADAVKNVGGYILRVIRPDVAVTTDHASETEMDAIVPDAVIENSGTLDDLAKKITAWLPR